MTQKTAIIYLRVSSVQQARRELPVESQLQFAHAKAKELGATVLRIFTDNGVSGRTDQRAEFQDAVKYCELYKPDYFIAWDTARFARNRIDAAQYKRDLREIGTDVVYVSMSIDSKTDEGWFLEALLEVMDESTSRRISKDTRRSMMKNAQEGFYNGGRVPFGYQTVEEGQRKRLCIKDDEAAIVREMFHLCGRGMGAKSIAAAMNKAGHLQRGRKWVRTNVTYLLKNQVYAGYTVFNRRKHHAMALEPEANWIRTKSHPAIIDEDTFMAIQELIGDRAPLVAAGSPKSRHLFTGLLKCGQCGGAMHIESATGRATTYHYYRCMSAKQHLGCNGRRVSAPAVDEFLTHEILDRILTRQRVTEIVRDIEIAAGSWWKDRERRRAMIVGEIRTCEQRRKKLFEILELHGKDAPNLADLTDRLRELKTQIENWEMNLVELEAQEDPQLDISDADIEEATAALRDVVLNCQDPVTVRTFFGSFVNKVTVEGDRAVIEYDPTKLMNHGNSVVHSKNKWLPEQALLRTKKIDRLVCHLPPKLVSLVAA